MATKPTGETMAGQAMAASDVVEVMLYPKAGQGKVLKTAFRNIYVCEKQCRPTANTSAAEKARRLRQLNDDVSWMRSDELKLSRSLSPSLRAGLKKVLDGVLDPDSALPDDAKSSLLALKQKWDSDNWGEETDDEDDSHNDLGVDDVVTIGVRPPPRDHPIYGERGIMHGVLFVRPSVYKLNPRVHHKSARSFGHNGIDVGSWWPLRIAALHDGAHGARVAGIAGDSRLGAFSVVLAPTYNDLDKDEGDVLYYSGPNSHDNTDPSNPPKATTGTKALEISLLKGRDVRVLRAGGTANQSSHAPKKGIRYDGLYEVVEKRLAKNRKGGAYEQFKLVRKPGQKDLSELGAVPNEKQRRDFEKVKEGY